MKFGVTLKSGGKGWRGRLHENYSCYEDFENADALWDLAHRLGFKSAINAWTKNPLIEGGTNPADYRKCKGIK